MALSLFIAILSLQKKTQQCEAALNYVTDDLKEQCFKFLEKLIPISLLNQLENEGQRSRKFGPLTTLKGFMFQCLSPEHSCRSAVIYILTKFKISGSLKTSAYCRSRNKLNTNILKEMALSSGKNICQSLQRVLWVDGTIFQMWDSNSNYINYPHSSRQKKGLGQPVIRALALFCAQTGAFLDVEFGKFKGKGQAEPSLLRKMLDRLLEGDTLVMDRFFTSPYLLQQIQLRKVKFIVRLRDSTAKDLIKRFKVKRGDGRVTVSAAYRSEYTEDFALGKEIDVRIVKSKIIKKGFRSSDLYIITSRFNDDRSRLESMYKDRWGIEVAFRNLKKTMGLGFIKAKSPEMVQREIWVSLITYNLIVCTINLTKLIFIIPDQISFKTVGELLFSQDRITFRQFKLITEMLATTTFRSPYRQEPRATKKRHNKYPILNIPRKQARKRYWKDRGQNVAA